ncbi:efflux transporter outer membrane subunit [Helicobacter sp. 11S03491-1]|uniref:efflux transporter outer membrane subunit n=1 Tax=Helicobacter sp. 11S03491-1 TaxID=1476196 RepID=UPI000BA7CF49|nr:efflux transporter outer membrane subunit [Helicobacter sp. 11S03491-1]PAF42996.1 hypothetical protein BKH45_02695 [Helicobacter sp. 11S03491-1]
MKYHHFYWAIGIGFLLCGCMPKIPELPKDSEITIKLDGKANEEINKNWWKNFNDENLLFLIQKARNYNSDIQISKTRIQAAMGALKIAKSTLFPSFTLNMSPQYTQNMLTPIFGFTTPIGMIDPTLNIAYNFDIFGKNTNERKSKLYQTQAIIAQSYGAKLSIDATVAKTYINLVALNDHLALLKDILKVRKIELEIAQSKTNVGYISEYDKLQASIQYEAAKAKISPTQLAITKAQNAMEELTGIQASHLRITQSLKMLKEPSLPKKIPSSILRNRPDIAYAEFELAASSATLAKARKNFLPDFNLVANIGGALFSNFLGISGGLATGAIGVSILTPLFEGNKLKGEFAIANAKRDEAAYTYKKIVLNAYKEIKNTQAGIEWLKHQQISLNAEYQAAIQTLDYAKNRYTDGYSSYLEVIGAKHSLLGLEEQIINLKTSYLESLINLYQALGSGFKTEEVKIPSKNNKKK